MKKDVNYSTKNKLYISKYLDSYNLTNDSSDLNDYKALKVVQEAYCIYHYDEEDPMSMCYCIYKALYNININPSHYVSLSILLPKFTADFLGGENKVFWWPLDDFISRSKAFHKLANYYKFKVDLKILYAICEARHNFLYENPSAGMCVYIAESLSRYVVEEDVAVTEIRDVIPIFSSNYLANTNLLDDDYWWEPEDVKSRLVAFNTLITYYEKEVSSSQFYKQEI